MLAQLIEERKEGIESQLNGRAAGLMRIRGCKIHCLLNRAD
jgi:hypothetical protein